MTGRPTGPGETKPQYFRKNTSIQNQTQEDTVLQPQARAACSLGLAPLCAWRARRGCSGRQHTVWQPALSEQLSLLLATLEVDEACMAHGLHTAAMQGPQWRAPLSQVGPETGLPKRLPGWTLGPQTQFLGWRGARENCITPVLRVVSPGAFPK